MDTTPLWTRMDKWRLGGVKAKDWDDLVDDLYRAQASIWGENRSLGDFDERHPGEADRLFLACGRWGWIQ